MRFSMISAAFVAAIVGFGSTIALVLAAATAVGASPEQTASWVAAVSVAKGLGSAVLSTWTRIPMVLAWSTPGAALIAASTGVDIHQAVGAFVFAGGLIALTAAIPALNRAVSAIPAGVAAAMLAGVLIPFCMNVALAASAEPALILPLIAVFVAVRLFSPIYAVLATLIVGLGIGWSGAGTVTFAFDAQPFVFIPPSFAPSVLIGLGLPLYLVTMASQNLPGFAVLRANGYAPPVAKALGVTGAGSMVAGLFGAHTFNMAAITAAICLGDDVDPNRDTRWRVGLVYGATWALIGLAGSVIVPAITAMPATIVAVIAGLALITPFIGAVHLAFDAQDTRFAAAVTFAVTASGVAALGIGAAFWGLVAGLAILLLDRVRATIAR